MRPEKPPRPVSWILQLLAAPEHRDDILGDLQEEFSERRASNRWAAVAWYWFQLPRELAASLRARLKRHPGGAARRPDALLPGWGDLRLAWRQAARNPGAVTAVVVALGLGISGATTVFAIVDGVLLRPLPYRDPDRLVSVWAEYPGSEHPDQPLLSPLDMLDFRARSEAFESFAGAVGYSVPLSADGSAEMVRMAMVTANLLPMLGVDPLLGRHFAPEEEGEGQARLVMISHDLWTGRFASDPAVIGRRIQVNGPDVEIVGVLPPDFRLDLPSETHRSLRDGRAIKVWEVFRFDLAQFRRSANFLAVVGRLRPDVSLVRAQTEMDSLSDWIGTRRAPDDPARRFRLAPLKGDVVKGIRPYLMGLAGSALVFLLIAVSKAANLQLNRMLMRRREIALRRTLGAGSRALFRQLAAENGLISLAATALGLAGGWAALQLLQSQRFTTLARFDDVAVDARVVVLSVLLCLATLFATAVVPLWHALRGEPLKWLRAGSALSRGEVRWRRNLVIAEVALTCVLLIGAGLFIRTMLSLRAVQPGFEAESLVTFRTPLPWFRYGGQLPKVARFHKEILTELSSLPGVEAAGFINQLPLSGTGATTPWVADSRPEEPFNANFADRRTVSPGYFESVGTRLLAGRPFDTHDNLDGAYVAIVDEALVSQAWPDGDAVGRSIKVQLFANGRETGRVEKWVTVVGVVENVRFDHLRAGGRPQIYLSYAQQPSASVYFTARTRLPAARIVSMLQPAVSRFDPDVPVADVRVMTDYVADTQRKERLSLALTIAFGAVSLLLSAVGLYAVLSLAVHQHRRELSIRMAMGAGPRDLVGWVTRRGVTLSLAGVGLGVATAIAVAHYVESLLFGVAGTDAVTYLAAVAVVVATALVASVLPARRAVRINPVSVLRSH